ncbi:MAG: methenyltetrahydromethanopterin cyclohydrolase [Methanospirillum sp.]
MILSVNGGAMSAVRELMDRRDQFGVAVWEQNNGATCLDCGVRATGSLCAGALFVETCLGGLASVALAVDRIGDVPVPFLHLVVNRPAIACLGAQKAGWLLRDGSYSAMASGPARALALKPKETYRRLGYRDDSPVGVLALEADALPGEAVTDRIAAACGIDAAGLYVLVAPAHSLVGAVQIPGRVVTATLHKLEVAGYDVCRVLQAWGRVPVAPLKPTAPEAVGTANDCIIYGGSVGLVVEDDDPVFATLPSRTSPDYGTPFGRLLAGAGGELAAVGSTLGFSPAEVTVSVRSTGEVRHYGATDPSVLLASFGLR